MGKIWNLPWQGTVTAAGGDTDLWEITPADDKPVQIRMIRLGQITEVADSAEEGLRITVKRLLATVTSGNGSAGTAENPQESNVAPGFSWEFNGTTVATSSGTTETVDEIGWINRQSPLEIWYPEDKYAPLARQTEVLVIRMETTLADDMTFVGMVQVEEL